VRSCIELSARIVVKAEGRWLGTMAKAVNPLAEDGSAKLVGEAQMPCFTHYQRRAWDIFQEGRSGGERRMAANASAEPGAKARGKRAVRGLFLAAVVTLASFGVSCVVTPEALSPRIHIELSARIVVKAEGRWLGTMSIAVNPLAEDGSYVPPARVT
jgi:hypothetical protein